MSALPCRRLAYLALLLCGICLLPAIAEPQEKSKGLIAKNGLAVSVSAPASDTGLAILKQGGNAVDAAVATAFALAVTHPAAGNIGGGGFMMIHPGAGK